MDYYYFCFRSKKHQFHKASTTADKIELSQRSNAIDNPTYVAIEGIMDEDVHAKIQDGEGIKMETKEATTVEPVTKVDKNTQDSTNSKEEGVSDSAVNGMSENEPAPNNINDTEGMTHTGIVHCNLCAQGMDIPFNSIMCGWSLF